MIVGLGASTYGWSDDPQLDFLVHHTDLSYNHDPSWPEPHPHLSEDQLRTLAAGGAVWLDYPNVGRVPNSLNYMPGFDYIAFYAGDTEASRRYAESLPAPSVPAQFQPQNLPATGTPATAAGATSQPPPLAAGTTPKTPSARPAPVGSFLDTITAPLAQATGLSSTTLLLIGAGALVGAYFFFGRGK